MTQAKSAERFQSNPNRLPADDFELHAAATKELDPCPFCGRNPLTFTERNPTTKLFVVRIICADCVLSMSSCMESREDARANVLERWSHRLAPCTSNGGDQL